MRRARAGRPALRARSGWSWPCAPGSAPAPAGARPAPFRAVAALLAASALAACAARPGSDPAPAGPLHDGPVVLITVGSLRADAVGAFAPPADRPGGFPGGDPTPALDRLVAEADWAGPAVAPSSFPPLSLATLATGLGPWDHGVTEVLRSALRPELRTLAEAFAERGYRGAFYRSGHWIRPQAGWAQGFAAVHDLGGGRRAAGHLAALGEGDGRQLLWIHLPGAGAPYLRRDWLLPRVGEVPPELAASLPERVEPWELERWADPAEPLPPGPRRVIETLYMLAVAHADDQLGELVAALRRSGRWDDTLLVVTSPSGVELGERGGTGTSGGLGRELLEVPLVVKLPRAWREKLPQGAGEVPPRGLAPGPRPSLDRVWATLVGAVGGETPPAAGPSLLRGSGRGALSEIYVANGANAVSLVEGDLQLVWTRRHAPAEPDYWRARLTTYRDPAAHRLLPPPAEPAPRIFGRLAAAFAETPPLSGGGADARVLSLVRWTEGGGTEPVDDPALAAAMAERLYRRWAAWQPCEAPPGPRPEAPARRR